MEYMIIDIETRSFADLPGVGAWKYSEHEKTDVLCCSYKTENMDAPGLWLKGEPVPDIFFEESYFYVAHNALFEYALFFNVMVNRYGWPEHLKNTDKWFCTQGMCRCLGIPPSLSDAAIFLNLPHKKDAIGKTLIQKISIPVKKKNALYFQEVYQEDLDAFYMYCKQDVKTEEVLYLKLKDTENVKLERAIYQLDFRQNVNGLPIDRPMLDELKNVLDARTQIVQEKAGASGILVTSNKQFLEYLRAHFIQAENVQEKTLLDIKKDKKTPGHIKDLIDLRLFLTRASSKKIYAVIDQVSPDNFIRYNLRYYGALTGRWAGQGFQPHNLTKTETSVEEIENLYAELKSDRLPLLDTQNALKKIIPGLIKAEKGKIFMLGDFKAIEMRVLAFMAGQKDLLIDIHNGVDLYKKQAARIYSRDEEDISKMQRQLGKVVILLSGYGGGYKKLHETCVNKFDLDIPESLAKTASETYRDTYKNIVKFWYNAERAFLQAWQAKKMFETNGVKFIGTPGSTTIKMVLPSGRAMYYHSVRVEGREISYSNKTRSKLYGGLLVENICQAVARDILCECMLKCDAESLNPILSVHDEILCYIDFSTAEKDIESFNRIMNTGPAWFPGFPLATDVELTLRYYK